MKKKLSPLEELRKKIQEEQKTAKKTESIFNTPTTEEISSFIDQTAVPAFEQIKREIKPLVREVQIKKYINNTIGFYARETASKYYCKVTVISQTRTMLFESNYTFPIESRVPGLRRRTLDFPEKQKKFQKLSEISAEQIIELFNKSFFSRIAKMEESIRKSKTTRYFDDNGEIPNPYVLE